MSEASQICVPHMSGYQKSGPLLGPLNTRCRIVFMTPKRDQKFGNHPYDMRHFWAPNFGVVDLANRPLTTSSNKGLVSDITYPCSVVAEPGRAAW